MPLQRKTLHINQLVFLLVALVLLGLWAVVLMFTSGERSQTLERAREQLQVTAITLADFNELAAQVELSAQGSDARTDALWRALLQYPSASIWVESGGVVTGGLPAADLSSSIVVEEARNSFVVYAALPEVEALADWRNDRLQRVIALSVVTLIVLVLAQFLVHALRLRTEAERVAAASEESKRQLQLYGEKLERTVDERTAQLAGANERLGEELKERKAAEKTLREHDALLSSVAKGAAELLGSHNNDAAIAAVLESIGKTITVSRVQLIRLQQGADGHFHGALAYEWCAPGLNSLLDDPRYQNLDLDSEYPRQMPSLLSQGMLSFHVDDIDPAYRQRYLEADMQSLLHIPVHMEGKHWGTLCFIDSVRGRRDWSRAETDTLRTLAGLIGVAMTRARYVKELADANTIVQNSPTILYRLKGEPPFPLIYVSHNIAKFGHHVEQLLDAVSWIDLVVAEEDRSLLRDAMSRMLMDNGAASALEFRLRTGSGEYRWVENRYTPVRDDKGRLVEVEGIVIDITERKAAEEKIAAMARTDALTGLANRATFNERLAQAFAATRRGAKPFAVFYMDLDRFKTTNDTLGHPIGDELLKETAKRLRQSTRETDLVARLGGDEFAVLQMDISEPSNAGTLAQNIQSILGRPMMLEGNELRVSSSIGICPWSPDIKDADSMLVQADLALYRAKEDGRNCYRFHSPALDREVMQRNELADELRLGIERGELELAWQPQVSIAENHIVGVEALVRWRHPVRGLMDAQDFIPVAEKTGSIMAIGHWVLDAACQQLREWRDAGVQLDEIALNLSQTQLKNSTDLITDVVSTTAKWGLTPKDLEFDVTEGMLAQTTWTQNDVLGQLHALGCKIAIDSFGTAYSSFDYLRAYDVNNLKVARSFIRDAMHDPEQANTIKTIIQMARDLGIGVVVEGVETAAQNALLQSLNKSANAQGYFYSRAVDGLAAGTMLKSGRARLQDARLVTSDTENKLS